MRMRSVAINKIYKWGFFICKTNILWFELTQSDKNENLESVKRTTDLI